MSGALCLSLRVGDIVAFDQGVQRGRTALIWAATEGKADCVRLLLDAGADKEATDEVRVDRRLSLFQACFGLKYYCIRFDWMMMNEYLV